MLHGLKNRFNIGSKCILKFILEQFMIDRDFVYLSTGFLKSA